MSVFKHLRFYVRYAVALTKRYYLVIMLCSLLGIIFALSLGVILKYVADKNRGTIKHGLVGQYTVTNLPNEIVNLLSFGLTKYQDNGEILPSMSDKWTVSPDGKRYEFFIIPDKFTWSNGKSFAITDINYTFQDVSVTTTDRSIIFNLNEAFSPLPSILSRPLLLTNLVGLGEYHITQLKTSGSVIKSLLLKYTGNLKKKDLLYRFYPTQTDLITGFNMGEIDTISGLTLIKNISEGKHIKIEPYTDYGIYTALYFNTDKPDFSDKSFRQALAYAINKPNDDRRALSSFSPYSWVYNLSVKPYIYDINRVFELVNKENLEKTRELVISAFPQDFDLAQQIVTDWQRVGIKSKVETINVIPENYDLLLVSRQIPLEVDQYEFWHSTQAGNLSKMRNPRLDKLLEDGRLSVDREIRKNIYLDFQRYLLEECPAVFLSHPTMYRVSRI